MGMPAQATHRWTTAEVRALMEVSTTGDRYELIDGELLVTPAPGPLHQRGVISLFGLVVEYCRRQRVGEAMFSPADLELQPGRITQPDIFVIPSIPDRPRIKAWPEVTQLLLAVEVLSPSSARFDRVVKRPYYQRAGVPEYWVIDLDARTVERWQPADQRPAILTDTLVWHPDNASAPLTVDLLAYFDEVLGL